MSTIEAFITKHSLRQVDLAVAMGVTESAVSHMLAGRFDPRKERIDRLLVALGERLGRKVTYEEVFGPLDVPAATGTDG
jgi:predicted transcriptional regulator